MTNEKDLHAEVARIMGDGIMGRHTAADVFRRIADRIWWGGTHDEPPHAIAQAVCEALARCGDWEPPVGADPFEEFLNSFVRLREAHPVAEHYRKRAQLSFEDLRKEAEAEGCGECGMCDDCLGYDDPERGRPCDPDGALE